MNYSIADDVRFSKKTRIMRFVPRASEVLSDPSRRDRYVTLSADGTFSLKENNSFSVQSKALPIIDGFNDEDVFCIIANAIAEAIVFSECGLLDSNTGDYIRQATPREVMESWIQAPTGHIDVDGRTCYAQF